MQRIGEDDDSISDENKIALSGKPKLGAISKIEVVIKESDEFKVSILITRVYENMPLSGKRGWWLFEVIIANFHLVTETTEIYNLNCNANKAARKQISFLSFDSN